ncbi:hypothetical protein B9Z55_003120 [Caenorhabditis nigoni]|uniref:Decapping nuclease n=1 Tax=Caenorhabditis nigoni TaxID=1611254 RepID=A0A2G5VNR4_9PELO|nr:hypothetical protein B9Z55_003120 [Caenorhabditis nigoni]
MSLSRSHPAKSGRILECDLEGVRCPATQDKQYKSVVNCPVVRQSIKDSYKLIARPQAAKYNDSAKHNDNTKYSYKAKSSYKVKCSYIAKDSYRARHNFKVQFSPEESRSRPYLSRQVKLNAFGTELSSEESAWQAETFVGAVVKYPRKNVFCGELPKKLNENRKYFDDPSLPVPRINLTKKEFPDSGAGEIYMESLLKYIRQNPSTLNSKPHFVTTRQLLCFIASEDYKLLKVSAIRKNGIIYLFKANDDTFFPNLTNFSEVYRHFMTKSSKNEEFEQDGVVRKGVFIAEIPKERGFWKVMYSGVVAAIDENMQHYEMKVFTGGLRDIVWKCRSCRFYWQAVFSDSHSIIVGTKANKYLKAIRLLPRSVIPPNAAEAARVRIPMISYTDPDPKNPVWNVEDGEKKLETFFDLVAGKLTNDGDECVFFKPSGHIYWNTEPCSTPSMMEILSLYGPTQLEPVIPPEDPKKADMSNQTFILDEIKIEPKSKIYFNVPFNRSCFMRITYVSMKSIAFKIASNHPDIKILPDSGSLGPHEFTMVEVKIEEHSNDYTSSRTKIEWTDWMEGKSIDEIFEEDGVFKRKSILVEFNE